MATVDINGTLIDFPDDLPPDQLQKAVASAAQQMGGQKSLTRKAWDALAIPEQKSQEGLAMMAGMVPNPEPTGKEGMISKTARALVPELALIPKGTLGDVARGAPKIMADTIAETSPSFVSRGSIVTGGLSKLAGLPKIVGATKSVLRSLGRQGESVGGSVPGALEAAYKDSTFMGAKGKKAVSQMYETAKAKTGGMRKELQIISDKREAVDKALKLAEEGSLNPYEALESRKELVKIKKLLPNAYFQYAKDKFNSVAKTVFGKEDEAYQRANMAESLRNIVPQNKYGGASAFKMALMSMAGSDGAFGKLVSLGLSPAVQGLTATGAGMVGRNFISPVAGNAAVGSGINSVIEALRRRKDKK